VKRTQLYLDQDLWTRLHLIAGQQGTTVSELVRQAAREKYLEAGDVRREAMLEVVGLWKDRADLASTEEHVRSLRRGKRLRRLER